ncbi:MULTISPECIES: Ti-type conjugative transfer relaxase TraA [unclassified Mesorhizobium]|uniref:Ti-type conjugative transfer relaxase TraA n=1 Tax=unclassified Mesorhizobium TaxID=325217 RepID=UPI00112A2403|nr:MULTISPECIES: Ti-type conjugative transfer relaxase TraA [unclassified Mesorhizobium]MBZ9894617.1 Ti-type conjugative transfer relaxase TraA [Mesorhizobium sp. BR1-1-6]TPM57461.1 Ti-type conjugative transfer relaxase TraA [Mesorhizobium sp. B2-2-4]TPM65735.1 Ti-type conjugative transfer relaxase TraA [Mesorhizobium sp. B2-2-1]TPN38355.1 Ti-type conjugative transfer relaxase TraA [Mesorhizobium sp. B1-1-6]TPN72061.1 Ti-type conjugative transfer relaxase TraA [Mesorhizobium sp. B1-1-3]
MAIFHLHVKVIGRKAGSSAVASAAYRSAARLRDERIERSHDFSAKRGVVHSEVMLPEDAPEAWRDRERLWNDVEAFEMRKDAQLAREVEFALPRELSKAQGIELARDFVRAEFVSRGMVADLNVHWDRAEDGSLKPHAHVMLTMRSVDENGFGAKVRDWNATQLVERWRERWAELANECLAERDIDARIDHRSLEAQGIALEPQTQIGAPAQRIGGNGLAAGDIEADRAELHREIARNNGGRIIADPSVALDAITHQQSTFTRKDIAKFSHRHSDGIEQFNQVMSAIGNAPDLVELGKDGRGEDRFTTRQMIESEQRLHRAAERIDFDERHAVSNAHREAALARAAQRGLFLSGEQIDALAHITDGRGLGVIVGFAGTGKSAMLGVARQAWAAAGYEVKGAALSGIAAENLEGGSGIPSRTIASMEHSWGQDRDLLTARDVLVIDEAGMVGTRQLERVLSHAADVGAKVVLVGDPQQLQAIEAGAAFRSLHERHGGVEIGQVRRQREDWQRDATRDLATGRIGAAISAYDAQGMVHQAATREEARGELVERWDRDRQAHPEASRIILTHTNDQVRALNQAARERMRIAGDLGDEVQVTVEHGPRNFAKGDRVMFLRNERGLGVKNGTLGVIEEVSSQSMTVRTDDGRSVRFDMKDYAHIDHGYAATIHKAQGMTVDRTHVLATPGMDAHGSYVALSRHRDGMDLHYSGCDFATRERLVRTLSRDRAKDMASDYERIDPAQSYAERRGITFRERVVEIVRRLVPEKLRDRIGELLDGLRSPADAEPGQDRGRGPERENVGALSADGGAAPERDVSVRGAQRYADAAVSPEAALRSARTKALVRHARAIDAILSSGNANGQGNPEQMRELRDARSAFEKVRPYGWRDAEAAYVKNPELVREAGAGRVSRIVLALQLETEIRTGMDIDPSRRADRFVERWQKLDRTGREQYQAGDMSGYRSTRSAMSDMAKSLERDPQLESLLANRKRELGINIDSGRRLGAELAFSHGIGKGRSLGL